MTCQAMICGVMFCGGCNPRFDRLKLFQQLKAELAHGSTSSAEPERTCGPIALVPWENGLSCRFLLLINGCSSECLLGQNGDIPALLINNLNQAGAASLVREFAASL